MATRPRTGPRACEDQSGTAGAGAAAGRFFTSCAPSFRPSRLPIRSTSPSHRDVGQASRSPCERRDSGREHRCASGPGGTRSDAHGRAGRDAAGKKRIRWAAAWAAGRPTPRPCCSPCRSGGAGNAMGWSAADGRGAGQRRPVLSAGRDRPGPRAGDGGISCWGYEAARDCGLTGEFMSRPGAYAALGRRLTWGSSSRRMGNLLRVPRFEVGSRERGLVRVLRQRFRDGRFSADPRLRL